MGESVTKFILRSCRMQLDADGERIAPMAGLHPDDLRALDALATERNMTRRRLVRTLIEHYIAWEQSAVLASIVIPPCTAILYGGASRAGKNAQRQWDANEGIDPA